MITCGIVAEFNPFHNGHAHLMTQLRRQGVTHIVAVMSGNFVQRGEPAFCEKRVRAQCALLAGADLVIELPAAFACATAETFSFGAVSLLKSLGCVDTLGFGSESGNTHALSALAKAIDSPAIGEQLRAFLAEGITFAKARQLAVESVLGEEAAALLQSPNNTLGVEYLRQAHRIGWNPKVLTTKRTGAAHDSKKAEDSIASASFLRSRFESPTDLFAYTPESTHMVLQKAHAQGLLPANPNQLETAVLSRLRSMNRQELAALPDLSEGLENRFSAAISTACTLPELLALAKTKRYTMARMRRLVWAAFLGMEKAHTRRPPPYLRVLGFNKAGREVLALAKQTAVLPLSTSLSVLEKGSDFAMQTAQLESRATDFYTLALPRPRPCGYDYTAPAVYL